MSSDKLGCPEGPFSAGFGPIDLNSFWLCSGKQHKPESGGELEVHVLRQVWGHGGPILPGFDLIDINFFG